MDQTEHEVAIDQYANQLEYKSDNLELYETFRALFLFTKLHDRWVNPKWNHENILHYLKEENEE